MNKFYYRIYGLTIVSEIKIQEAYECEVTSTPDVEVVLGEIPEFLKDAKAKGYGTWTGDFVNAWFNTPGAAQYYIEHGRKIIVEPEENANMDLVCSMILSAGLCLVLLQRNEPVIHGSAIATDNKAVMICGESGAGKSTITLELLRRNVGFLADDTVRLRVEPSGVYAEPTYPQQKLCRDQVEKYGFAAEKLRYIDEFRDKFALMRRDIYVDKAMPLACMIILKKSRDSEKVFSKQLSGQEFLTALIDNLYLSDTYKNITGVPVELMQKFIMLASHVMIYEVYRPMEGDTVEAVLTEIDKVLQLC